MHNHEIWKIVACVVIPCGIVAAVIHPGISIAKALVNGALKAHDQLFG